MKPIPSTGGVYAADANGAIWRVSGYGTPKPRKLKPSPQRNGYLNVSVSVDNRQKRVRVHRLVAEAFLGPGPKGHDVCHLNHDRTDNRPENLKYGTRSENCKMSSANYGHWLKGVKPSNTKLKEHQNLEIVARYAAGAYQQDIADEYGVTQGLVSKIIRTRFPNA